jgi:hypothetical protein
MRRVSSNLLLTSLFLILISGFSTSADRVVAAGVYNRVWQDSFNSTTWNPDWTILHENIPNRSLVGNNYLRITTETEFLENNQEHEPFNQFMINVPDGDFNAMTYVNFSPGENGQFAGMRIRMSTLDYIEIHLTYGALQNQVDWQFNQGGTLTHNFISYDKAYPGIYLRIRRTGNTYIGEVNSTETTDPPLAWWMVGSTTADYPTALIGLVAGNSQTASSIPADFDLFRIQYYAPYILSLPVVRR